MSAATYAHCITGRPPSHVLVHGRPLARFDTIERGDGTSWRYEGLGESNTLVLASVGGAPARRFALREFGIAVVVGSRERPLGQDFSGSDLSGPPA